MSYYDDDYGDESYEESYSDSDLLSSESDDDSRLGNHKQAPQTALSSMFSKKTDKKASQIAKSYGGKSRTTRYGSLQRLGSPGNNAGSSYPSSVSGFSSNISSMQSSNFRPPGITQHHPQYMPSSVSGYTYGGGGTSMPSNMSYLSNPGIKQNGGNKPMNPFAAEDSVMTTRRHNTRR